MSQITLKRHHLAGLFVTIALVAAILPFVSPPKPTQAASGTHVYLSPASQTVTTGSNIVVSVKIDTGGAAINTVQSVLTYNPANFSFVSIALGPSLVPPDGSYLSPFTYSTSSGSVQFSAAPPAQNVTSPPPVVPMNGSQIVVVTVTLHATGTGTSAINFASVCGSGNFAPTCTAAYDNSTNLNDLIGATTPTSNGTYTVSAASSPSSTPSSTPSTTTSTSNTGSSSSGSSSSTSSTKKTTSGTSSTSASSSTSSGSPATTAPTPTTTTTNPVPVLTNITTSNITNTSATISWQTNIPASSVVDYGLNNKYGLVSQTAAMTTSHRLILSNLTKATPYYFVVAGATGTGASATSTGQQFTTSGFTVTIKVVDSKGKPLQGAKVTSDGQTQTTNKAGLVTLSNMPAGPQKVAIKAGRTLTNGIITVGKIDPKTGAYQPQAFVLKAAKGSSLVPYIVVAVIALAAAAGALFVNFDALKSWLRRISGNGSGGMPGTGMDGPGGDVIVSGIGSPAPPSAAPISTSSNPIQVVRPGSSPDEAGAAPIVIRNVQLGKPHSLEPGRIVEPSEIKEGLDAKHSLV